jgi:hypothetical protein
MPSFRNRPSLLGAHPTSTAKKRTSNVSFAMDQPPDVEKPLSSGEEKVLTAAGAMDIDVPFVDMAPDYDDNYFDNNGADDYGFNDRLSQDHIHSPMQVPKPEALNNEVNFDGSTEKTTGNAGKKAVGSVVPAPLPVINKAFIMHDPHNVLPGSKPIRKGKPYRLMKKSNLTEEEKFLKMLEDAENPTNTKPSNSFLNYNVKCPLFFDALLPLYKLKQSVDRKERMANLRQKKQQSLFNGQEIDGNDEEDDGGMVYHNLYEKQGISNKKNDDIPAELEFIYHDQHYGDDDAGGGDGGHDDYYDFGADVPFEPPMIDDGPIATNGEDDMFGIDEEEELAKRVEAALNDQLNLTQTNSYESICKQYIEGFHSGASSHMK